MKASVIPHPLTNPHWFGVMLTICLRQVSRIHSNVFMAQCSAILADAVEQAGGGGDPLLVKEFPGFRGDIVSGRCFYVFTVSLTSAGVIGGTGLWGGRGAVHS